MDVPTSLFCHTFTCHKNDCNTNIKLMFQMLDPFCWPSKLTRSRRPKGRRTSVRDRNEFPLFPHHDFIPDYYSDTCQGNQTAYSLIFFYPSAIPSLLVLQSAMRTRTFFHGFFQGIQHKSLLPFFSFSRPYYSFFYFHFRSNSSIVALQSRE